MWCLIRYNFKNFLFSLLEKFYILFLIFENLILLDTCDHLNLNKIMKLFRI